MYAEFTKPLCCLYTVSFRPQTCRDFTCQVTTISLFILNSVLSPVLAVSSVSSCLSQYPAPWLEQPTGDKTEAMEEAKLIRMAAAISEYTVSSMLRETVHSAAESINQAVLSVETLLWIPEHLLSELAEGQQDLARL